VPAEYGPSLGADAFAFVGFVPSVAWGGGIFVEVAPAHGTFVPSFRVTAIGVTASPLFGRNIGADTTWELARLEACPLRPELSRSLRLESCAYADTGALIARGTGLDHPSTETKPWFSFGALARFRLALGSGVGVEAGPALAVPTDRYPFQYGQGSQTFETGSISPVAVSFSAGVSYRFP
jgi:hypothetical protein